MMAKLGSNMSGKVCIRRFKIKLNHTNDEKHKKATYSDSNL